MTSQAIKIANKATAEQIACAADIPNILTLKDLKWVATANFKLHAFYVGVATSKSLSPDDREDVWKLYEANMRALVEPSSFGWNPDDKKAELFEESSRFIMVRYQKDSQVSQSTLVAFSMFRFELGDEDEDSIYCYELQVVEDYRGYGFGHFFVDKLTRIRKHWKMEKILLTCLKTNISARFFYTKTGFVLYTGSPEYDGTDSDENYDYEILSKS